MLGRIGDRGIEIGRPAVQLGGLVLDAEQRSDLVDLRQDTVTRIGVRHRLEGNAGAAQDGQRFRRAGALDGNDRRRVHGENAFGRQRPHVADVGQLQACSGNRLVVSRAIRWLSSPSA
jgi:hypothetical protein